MIADKLAALREAALTPPGEDDEYAEVALEHERGSGGFSGNGAKAVAALINDAAPALEALVRAAEELEEPCPADNWNFEWEKRVQAASARLRVALAKLDKVLS